ncbi:MAG: type II/IV secretion system ATPase subunit [Nitrososphaerota archaeon]
MKNKLLNNFPSFFLRKNFKKNEEERVKKTIEEIYLGIMRRPLQFKPPKINYEIIESYNIGEIKIYIGERNGEGLYFIEEPKLTPLEEIAYSNVLDTLYYTYTIEEIDENERMNFIKKQIEKSCKNIGLKIQNESIKKVLYFIEREIFNYSVVDIPMKDKNIEDIACNGADRPITVFHRNYGNLGWLMTNIVFESEEQLSDFIRRMAYKSGKGINVAIPYSDFILPNGSRMVATLGTEISRNGSSFTIRKFPEEPLTLPFLVKDGMLSSIMAAYLWHIVEKKKIIFIAGPTASGKTTLSNALLSMLDPKLRYITIEDTPEIKIPTWRWIPHITRKSYSISLDKKYDIELEDLMILAMRERPDYLIVGEVRSPKQLVAFIESATTGHGGVTTIHANDPNALLIRLKSMKMESSALDLLWGAVITNYLGKGIKRIRRVTNIVEINQSKYGNESIELKELFKWNKIKDSFEPEELEEVFKNSNKLMKINYEFNEAIEDIKEKKDFIEELIKRKIFDFHDVSNLIRIYYTKKVLEKCS